MVEAALIALGLAVLSCPSKDGEPLKDGEPFIEIFTAGAAGPAGEVLHVFAADAPEGEELHVLSRRGQLGTFRVVGDAAVAVPNPELELPDDLGAGRNWVFASDSIGAYGPGSQGTLFERFFPSEAKAERSGSWGVLSSGDGSAAFFVRGGTEVEHPAELAVMDIGPDGVAERFTRTTTELPRIQSSLTGDLVVIQTSRAVEIQGAEATQATVAPGGRIHLQPSGDWLVQETAEVVELRSLINGSAAPLAVQPPLMAVEFEGQHVLVVGRTRAELYQLDDPSRAVLGVDATEKHRFSSAALSPRGGGGPPWIALGELAVIVPQLVLPDAPAARASALARVVDSEGQDREGQIAEEWPLEVGTWRGNTPFVQWSRQGRLIVSTKDRVLASERLYR